MLKRFSLDVESLKQRKAEDEETMCARLTVSVTALEEEVLTDYVSLVVNPHQKGWLPPPILLRREAEHQWLLME